MSKIKIFRHQSVDLNEVIDLLEKSGCVLPEDGHALSQNDNDSLFLELEAQFDGKEQHETSERDAILIVLTAEICSHGNIEEISKQSINSGDRLIAIWPRQSDGNMPLPSILGKYVTSVVQWDTDEIKRAICDQEIIHKNSDGTDFHAPQTDRNCC
jgi:hypothetical protein|tara:strand:+ start:427 stop:894 length:468 start_codon:yes stop_codon:yes gene_type:complete